MRQALPIVILVVALVGCGEAVPGGQPAARPVPSPTPETSASTQALGAIHLPDFPIVPRVSQHMREVYQAGLAQGRNPQVFSKVGNCMTASPDYLVPFSGSAYNLGDYGYLQQTIDYYRAVTIRQADSQKIDSFSNPSLAAASGFTSAGPLDHIWANPNFCRADESPLDCEYRVSNPSLALILFGTNDVYYLDAAKFERYMRSITEESLRQEVLPVLITFPPLPDRLQETEQFNQIVARLSVEYDVPLVNLWLALINKPGYGVDPTHFTRLTVPADGCAGCLTQADLEAGVTTENLVMLQALDTLRQELPK